jgi:hypothetical protein
MTKRNRTTMPMSLMMVPCKRCKYWNALDKTCRALPKAVAFQMVPDANPLQGTVTMRPVGLSGYPECNQPTDGCYSGSPNSLTDTDGAEA